MFADNLQVAFVILEPKAKNLLTVRTNFICTHLKQILRFAQNDNR